MCTFTAYFTLFLLDPFFLLPVFAILAEMTINRLSYRCDVLQPHWGRLLCDLASSWFSCRVILSISVPLSAALNSNTATLLASTELFILFSCERMELSRCITDLGFSGRAHCFPWPSHLKSVETGLFFMPINGLFSWIHEGMLVSSTQSGAPGFCSIFTHSIKLRLIRYG